MRRILEDFCNDASKSNGLLLIDMPTGTGKTYSVAEYIANNYNKIKGKIFFITQLKKNLPEDAIRECFKKIGKESVIDDVLLRVENNVDNLCKNFHSVKEYLYNNIGDHLLLSKIEREVNLINMSRSVKDDNMFLIQQARDDLQNELERALRDKVSVYLKYNEDGNERTLSQKKNLLENDDKYKWITTLYPATQTYKKKIFIMSLDKFLYRYSTIIEPSFYLFESDLLNNSIVFMDEFDGTKDVILNKIIRDGLDNRFGIVELFREIYAGLFNTEFTNLLTQESEYNKETNKKRDAAKKLKTPVEVLSNLRKSAENIYNNYNFIFQFKIHERFKEGNKFLFQDYTTHTIVDGDRKKLELEDDSGEAINWIKVSDNTDENNTRKREVTEPNNDRKAIIPIGNLLNSLQRLLREFQNGIRFIADNYFHLRRERGQEEYNISPESSIRTVLSEFGIDGRYQNYLTINIMSNAKRHRFDWKRLSDVFDASVYENGFRYYHIIDSDNHDTISKMDYVAFNDSPEKFLCRLINRTKVVGISATATIPSPLANYDLKYLKTKCKGLIFEPDDIGKKRLREHFYSYVKDYKATTVESRPIGSIDSLSSFARELYEHYAKELDKNLNADKPDTYNYLKQRLLCFTEAVDIFFGQNNGVVKSFLYFANTKGAEYRSGENNILFLLFEDIRRHYKKQGVFKFLYGNVDEFDKRKDEIQLLLKNGSNVFVYTTYATMGAGQNIHYEYDHDLGETVKVNSLGYNLTKKDFDAVYLELPSHVLVNNHSKIDTDEEFIKYIYQIKFLQEAGDYRPYEALYRIKTAFLNRETDGSRHNVPAERRSSGLLLAYARIVQQAVGRICRTPNKSKKICVFYQSDLARFISPVAQYYDDKPVNPEFRAFLDSCKKNCPNDSVMNDPQKFERLAESRDLCSVHFKDSIRALWNKDSVDMWERMRDAVLRSPTIADLTETEFGDIYIELPYPANKYYVLDKNDKSKHESAAYYSFKKRDGYKCVSAYSVLLPRILNIPGVREYFNDKGYAVYFEPNKYMLSEAILKSIYQGALGEVVGRFIIEKKMLDILGSHFERLPINVYEKFDNKIKDVYFDFKNWNGNYNPKLKTEISDIRRKMRLTQADKLVIVNILKPEYDVAPYREKYGDSILILPYLYDDHDKKWNYDGLKKLFEILIEL